MILVKIVGHLIHREENVKDAYATTILKNVRTVLKPTVLGILVSWGIAWGEAMINSLRLRRGW